MASRYLQQVEDAVDLLIEKIGKNLVVGAPLGAGKPNHLLNAIYLRAQKDSSIKLTIATALTLEKPKGVSELEKRFLAPMVERVFADYPDLIYEIDRRDGRLPENIEIVEFYFPPGKYLNNSRAQQNYVSSNYTHVARDMMDRGVNVLVQMVSRADIDGKNMLSLSCNADVSNDLVPMMRSHQRSVMIIGQLNQNLPFMYGDALVNEDFFDVIVDNPAEYYQIFGPPKMSVSDADFLIGLHASALVRDDGELQVGIGSLGDALIYALCLRQDNNDIYQQVLEQLSIEKKNQEIINHIGGTNKFEKGLFGATEMIVDGFMHLYKSKILKKQVYDHVGLQRLINEGLVTCSFDKKILDLLVERRIISSRLSLDDFNFLTKFGIFKSNLTFKEGLIYLQNGDFLVPDLAEMHEKNEIISKCLGHSLKNGEIVHGGFFLGPQSFYHWLKELSEDQRRLFAMKSVLKINQLYGHEEIDRLHRKNARFINSCMMTTLSGAHVSDGLEDGRVISGVGGQYNFVAMAQELPDGHSILTMRSTRMSKGKLLSNIVFNYGHVTIPRHMRDIVVTEYGIANLRGKTDQEIIKALLNIADSRFQPSLLAQAKAAGKLAKDYTVPKDRQRNDPMLYQTILKRYKQQGFFSVFPFGTDFTETEKMLGKALKGLKADSDKGRLHMLGSIFLSLFSGEKAGHLPLLERMGLTGASNLRLWLFRKLLVNKFNQLGLGIVDKN